MKLFNKIFKQNKKEEQSDLTTITRTEVFEGFSIPGIIHNMQYHFTDLQIYSDGLISCWEMVDLPMFRDKLNQGWVVTSIPDGEAISIFSLGYWVIDQGEWEHNIDSLYEYVHSLVKKLNPKLENLHQYNGSSTKMIGKVNFAKHSIPDATPYHFDDPNSFLPNKIYGNKFHFFYRNDDEKTYLAELSIYKDRYVEITNLPSKKIYKFEDLKELAEQGILTTDLQIGETITMLNLGSFKIVSGQSVDIKLKLAELQDKLNELNGEENSIAKYAKIFDEYLKNPTLKLRDMLKNSYENIPEHQRIYVGTMDTKDYEVRQIIYGDIIKKEFEQKYGYQYPHDDMPKPIDE